jgi:hypothetical protein
MAELFSSRAEVSTLATWQELYLVNYHLVAVKAAIAKAAAAVARGDAVRRVQTVAAAVAAVAVRRGRGANAADFLGPFLNTTPQQKLAQDSAGHSTSDHTKSRSVLPIGSL